ncbi:MAG: hypothetical protein MPN21_25930 [Thermoanaerobaculia bacterium]|nr:hypothetical protein [Thermoanaerobaculia bacterium]
MMMNCRELAEIVARGGELSLRQRLALRLHLRLCPPCRDYAEQIDKLGEVACDAVEADMSRDCCQETVRRLENSILTECGLAEEPVKKR